MTPHILRLIEIARIKAAYQRRGGGKHRLLIIRTPSWRELLRHSWN